MRRYLLLFISLCVVSLSFAQSSNKLSGVIEDENGDAVGGAVVSWLALPDSTLIVNGISDATGRFSLVAPKSVPDSSVVVVSCIGYVRSLMTVDANQKNDLHFTLKEMSLQLQGVTVTAKSTMKGVPGGIFFQTGWC